MHKLIRGSGKPSASSKGKNKLIEDSKDESMKAIIVTQPGGPDVLRVVSVPRPKPGRKEVLIKVHYVGVNRPDIDERKSKYKVQVPTEIEGRTKSEYLGLECSGVIIEHGTGLTSTEMKLWSKATEVCAILFGGGYAEYVAVPIGHLFPKPPGLSMKEAASLPQAACIVWTELFMNTRIDELLEFTGDKLVGPNPRLRCDENHHDTLLIHGGCSGIGLFAIQMAKYKGATVFVTAGSEEKLRKCRELGADLWINYKTEDFVDIVLNQTQQQGVDVILDCSTDVGAYIDKNLRCLKTGGRLIQIGDCYKSTKDSQSKLGSLIFIDAGSFVYKRPSMRALVVKEVTMNVWPLIEKGQVRPVLHKGGQEFRFKKAFEAHRLMEEGRNIGKILLAP